MQVILDSPFARPSSAPIGGGKKGEFRNWTKPNADLDLKVWTDGTFAPRLTI